MGVTKKILIVTPLSQAVPFYREELKKRGLDIDIITIVDKDDKNYFSPILTRVGQQIAAGKEIIITRGTLAEEIRSRFQVQVVELEITDFDVLKTMRKYIGSKASITVVECESLTRKVKRIGDLLGVPVTVCTVSKISGLKEGILDAAQKGVDVIIGGGWGEYDCQHMNLLKPYNVTYELIGCSEESVVDSVERASEMYYMIQAEKQQKEMLRTIINFSDSGLVAIDKHGKISIFNSFAQNIFGLDGHSKGQSISQVLPQLHLHEILQTKEREENRILRNLGLVVTNVPLIVEQEILGAVSTFQYVKDLEESGRKLRSQMCQRGLSAHYTFDDLIGSSSQLEQTKNLAQTFCRLDSTVLITGETGTGKEVFAQSIHNASTRKDQAFVAINCSALPSSLLESELFGYTEGAFTGAKRGGKAGIFELAHKGTIFLDEIGEIDKGVQVQLLRIVQEKEVRRIGDDKMIPIDVRVIAATNKDLYEEVLNGNFRDDLYFRLSILNVHLPPLRKRKEDIPLLVDNLITNINQRLGCSVTGVDNQIIQVLQEYSWPGNIRELQNTLEKIVVLTREGEAKCSSISPALQDLYYRQQKHDNQNKSGKSMEDIELQAILRALDEEGGNKTKAALRLGIDRSTLLRKIDKYDIKNW